MKKKCSSNVLYIDYVQVALQMMSFFFKEATATNREKLMEQHFLGQTRAQKHKDGTPNLHLKLIN